MARRELRRGDIRWHRFSSPDKRRPVLVLGRDSMLRSVSEVPVIPFSTHIRGLPWEVVLNPNEGLEVASALKPEWIRCVPVRELGPWICSFPAPRWQEVRMALLMVLGLDVPADVDLP
jgi:mRNA interferase MazF